MDGGALGCVLADDVHRVFGASGHPGLGGVGEPHAARGGYIWDVCPRAGGDRILPSDCDALAYGAGAAESRGASLRDAFAWVPDRATNSRACHA